MQYLHTLPRLWIFGLSLNCLLRISGCTFRQLGVYLILLTFYGILYIFGAFMFSDTVNISLVTIIAGILMRIRFGGDKTLTQVKIVRIPILI